jgi:hypothetical protein
MRHVLPRPLRGMTIVFLLLPAAGVFGLSMVARTTGDLHFHDDYVRPIALFLSVAYPLLVGGWIVVVCAKQVHQILQEPKLQQERKRDIRAIVQMAACLIVAIVWMFSLWTNYSIRHYAYRVKAPPFRYYYSNLTLTDGGISFQIYPEWVNDSTSPILTRPRLSISSYDMNGGFPRSAGEFWAQIKFDWTFSDTNTPSTRLRIPLWFPFLLLAIHPYFWLRHRQKLAIKTTDHRCEHCGYDLRASTERCPECGEPIQDRITARSSVG